MKGIHRAAAQRGPAALSITTSPSGPYEDTATDSGVLYAYRAGGVDQADNRALRAAVDLRVPLVYFVGTRPGFYTPIFPSFLTFDDRENRCVHVAYGRMIGPLDEREAVPIADGIERRYVVREMNVEFINGVSAARCFRHTADRCAVSHGSVRRAMDAGAAGFVVKDTPAAELAGAVRRVHAGLRVVDPDLATESLIEGLNPLSPREQDVLAAALSGAPVAEIARALHLSVGTVRNYLSTAAAKTQARSSAEAAVIARDRGWL